MSSSAYSPKYVVEVRGPDGLLDFGKEQEVRKQHPYLFSKPSFTIDELCYYASYGQGRDKPTGTMDVGEFLAGEGISHRAKDW